MALLEALTTIATTANTATRAFDRAFNVCHGRVTSGASLSYLVESVHAGSVNFDFPSAENGILPFLSMESFEIAEPPPSYSRIEEPEIQL